MARRIALLGLLLLCAASAALAEEEINEAEVIVLKDAEFDKQISSRKFMLVEFYAPWCGHCKALKPEYAKAALALKDYSEDVGLAKVDATEEKDIAGKFEIQGYPTLKWFIDGKEASDYSGGRTADDIVRWIKKKTGPATTEIADVEALEKAKKESTVFVLGYFDKYEGEDYTSYEAAAQKSDDAAFLKTTSADVAKALGLEKAGFALGRSYPDFGFEAVSAEGHKAMEDALDVADGLEAFIKAEKLPAFTEFSQDTSSAIFGSGINSQVIVTAPGDLFAKDGDLFKALVGVSSKLKGKVVLVTAKTESENAKPIIDYFGLSKEETTPQVVGFDSGAGKKFKFEGEVNVETLTKFAEDVIEGKAKKFFKSSPEPAEPLDKGVAVVTGNTVESIVKDPKKDVLLEVYAPWCGHCKSLAPIYEKLAKRFAKIDSVVIAKMDGTENEHPEIEAQGFPTLMFFPAEEGAEPIPYDGGRTLGEMTKFIKKNAKVPFELPKKKKSKDAEAEAKEEDTKDEL